MKVLTYDYLRKTLQNVGELLVIAKTTSYGKSNYVEILAGNKYFLKYDAAQDAFLIMLPNSDRHVVEKYKASSKDDERYLKQKFLGYVNESIYCLVTFKEKSVSYRSGIVQFVEERTNARLIVHDEATWIVQVCSVDINDFARKAPARTDETLFTAVKTGIGLEIDIEPAEYSFFK